MATQPSTLPWEIPRTGEPGGLQSVGRRVGQGGSDRAHSRVYVPIPLSPLSRPLALLQRFPHFVMKQESSWKPWSQVLSRGSADYHSPESLPLLPRWDARAGHL